MTTLLEKAKADGYRKVILWTCDQLIVARKYYAKLGFTCTQKEENRHWDPNGKLIMEELWEMDLWLSIRWTGPQAIWGPFFDLFGEIKIRKKPQLSLSLDWSTEAKAEGELNDVLLSLEIQPTIIGAKAFHCPVRNGKEWDRLAMVV